MDPPVIELFVFEALQANAGADFVCQLVEAFAEEAPVLVAQMRSALTVGDTEAFETTAHSLKSNGVAFGAQRLADLATQLESRALTADDAAIATLAAEVDAAVAALRRLALL